MAAMVEHVGARRGWRDLQNKFHRPDSKPYCWASSCSTVHGARRRHSGGMGYAWIQHFLVGGMTQAWGKDTGAWGARGLGKKGT